VFWVSNNTTAFCRASAAALTATAAPSISPFATLNYAITQCVANRGDIIFIKPGHAESIASQPRSTSTLPALQIVGLGVGSNRPTFTFTTANTATIPVSAEQYVDQELPVRRQLPVDRDVLHAHAAADFNVERCEFRDTDRPTASCRSSPPRFRSTRTACATPTTPQIGRHHHAGAGYRDRQHHRAA
jgi:hypothetical protein